MPARRRPTEQRVRLIAMLLMAVAIVGACNRNGLNQTLVAGTGHVRPGGNSPWFTISPDEKWIAFMDVDSTAWDVEEARRRPGSIHLVTVNLATGRKTHHRLDHLPKGTITTDLPPWVDLQLWFEARSWEGGQLYIRVGGGVPPRPWISFSPGVVMARRVEQPTELSCCACGPVRDYPGVLKSRGIGGRFGYTTGTAAYQEGKFSKTIYASPILNENGAVDRVNADDSVDRIFEEKRRFRKVEASNLLVSPDERFLAIVLTTSVRSPIPLPTMRDELHVLDLQSGQHLRVGGSYRLIGDLMWSEDSQRLYYAAVDGETGDGKGDGVFVISLPH